MADGDVYRCADGTLAQMFACEPLDDEIFYGPASHICRGGKVFVTNYEDWISTYEIMHSIKPAKYSLGTLVEYADEGRSRYVSWRYYFGEWTYALMIPGIPDSEVYVSEREISRWARRRITRE